MLRSLLLLTIMIVTLVGISLPIDLYDRHVIAEKKKQIPQKAVVNEKLSENLVEKINKNRPEVLLIGNSMLGEAVDADRLTEILGLRCLKVWVGGTDSAWLYLFIKNIVPQLRPKPQYIGIFFRDNFLTLPQFRVSGKHKEWIDSLAGPDEPLLNELAYFHQMSFLELLIVKTFPVYSRSAEIKAETDAFLKKIIAAAFSRSDENAMNQTINATFADQKMDEKLSHQRQMLDENTGLDYLSDMTFNPEESFLPAMLHHAHENGAELFFVRVKRKRDLEPGNQPENLVDYTEKLKLYLKEHNAKIIDYTDNRSIVEAHYGRGDHLNRQEGMTFFTALLAKDLSEQITAKNKQ